MPRDESSAQRTAQLRLGRLPGYVRRPDPARRGGEDGRAYKKGWEVRFTARSEAEITEIRDLVVAAGFAPARPFFKGQQLIQPVYGIAAVEAYLAAREAAERADRSGAQGAARAAGRPDARTGGEPDPAGRATPAVPAVPGAQGRAAIPEQSRREAAPAAAAAAAVAAAAAADAALRARRSRAAAVEGADRTGC
ncbi:hypothetical protein ACGFX4_28960 [Kitasatospora sp. NPDC048365]|uniref:hypothetical protein n=1 Tax=Kitasatospora sp. NPDC048365 TaxID=3364050 RepID=UPI00371DECE6